MEKNYVGCERNITLIMDFYELTMAYNYFKLGKQKYNALFLEISKQIPNETYIELSKITDEINRDKFALTVPYRFEIFQDLFDENQRKRIDIINFLLWNVE
jgi:nicotinic acid phosphoribosyltransferase